MRDKVEEASVFVIERLVTLSYPEVLSGMEKYDEWEGIY